MVKSEQGQGTIEYILILAAIATFALVISKGLKKFDLARRLSAPLTEDFRYAYQYGHPKSRGYDDGGPKKHPRASRKDGGGGSGDEANFRIFIAPGDN